MEVTPEMRKNNMIMMEEFRRRKNLKHYWNYVSELENDKIKKSEQPHRLDGRPESATL